MCIRDRFKLEGPVLSFSAAPLGSLENVLREGDLFLSMLRRYSRNGLRSSFNPLELPLQLLRVQRISISTI
eukprot:11116028-Alexandrium_andersonii.AAC.1